MRAGTTGRDVSWSGGFEVVNNLEPRELSSWQGRDGTDAGAHGGLWENKEENRIPLLLKITENLDRCPPTWND